MLFDDNALGNKIAIMCIVINRLYGYVFLYTVDLTIVK